MYTQQAIAYEPVCFIKYMSGQTGTPSFMRDSHTRFELLEKVDFADSKSPATTERQDYCWETKYETPRNWNNLSSYQDARNGVLATDRLADCPVCSQATTPGKTTKHIRPGVHVASSMVVNCLASCSLALACSALAPLATVKLPALAGVLDSLHLARLYKEQDVA